ncbi:putative bifunctional diguanylate cyclase/phosphodiesterase [Caldimonas sp. KR1-144]|uniref:putative bifunctional diguanylate cyclase/phosphodiesterase n=1 Tax=Caldimonas sp. KR1-144 TaxID=3400911 RepID=UPI003BFD3637
MLAPNLLRMAPESARGEALSTLSTDDLARVLSRLAVPVLVTDARGIVRYANAAMFATTGYARDELVGARPRLMKSGLQDAAFYQQMWRSLRERRSWGGEVWNRRKDGSLFRVWLDVQALAAHDGELRWFVGSYRRPLDGFDPEQVSTDALTGVLSRARFTAAVDALREAGAPVRLTSTDIRDFTRLNESLGIEVGDRLLRQVALRCTAVAAATRCAHAVGRVGADQFAVAVAGAVEATASLGEQLRASLAEPFDLGFAQGHAAQFSFGETLLRCDEDSAAEALVRADAARLDAALEPHLAGDADALGRERDMFADLQRAILDGSSIRAAYQPQVDLESGGLVGVEALARWRRRHVEDVPPGVFVSLAERRHLILPLGERMLDAALADFARWRAQGVPVPRVAVNFSAEQFHRPGAARRVREALERHGLGPDCLELELTESMLIGDIDEVLRNLHELRAAGVMLSIDDFGTGYSSLAYLRRFPIHRLKIDRAFVADLGSGADAAREVVSMIVKLAHQFGLRCLAEGVETQAQCDELRALGCDEAQGFLFARPMVADALASFAAERA